MSVCFKKLLQGPIFQIFVKISHIWNYMGPCSCIPYRGGAFPPLPPRSCQREQNLYQSRIYQKKCKTAILLYCFHTAGVLYVFALYNLLGPGISFYRKSKIFPYNYKSNDVFYSPNSLQRLFSSFKKFEILGNILY